MTKSNRRTSQRRSRRSRKRAGWFRRHCNAPEVTTPLSFTQRLFGKPCLALPAPIQLPSVPNPFQLLDPEPRKLVFDCQLAHGSATSKITNVGSLQEMYQAVAQEYPGTNADDILFCTVNTHQPDMDRLLSNNLALDDFIFAHLKGQKKEVTFVKTEGVLGLTVTDNSNGLTFIKRIQPDSVCAKVHPAVDVGDHVERVNNESMIGKRHYQVAKVLRSIPVGEVVTLRLVAPLKNGFSFISKRQENNQKTSLNVGSGIQTLRFYANGQSVVEEAPDKLIIEKINLVFEEYLGLNDDELALSIWELGRNSTELMDMSEKLRQSDELRAFDFPDELVFDIWGIVDDHKNDRINPKCAEQDVSK